MTQLFCIRTDGFGTPCAARLYRRKMRNGLASTAEMERLETQWTKVVRVWADNQLQIQFAEWASKLLHVNPRYVLNPRALINYIRGANWNHPDPQYAHYEQYVKGFGDELWHEFSTYRVVPHDEAVRRMTLLIRAVGMEPNERL